MLEEELYDLCSSPNTRIWLINSIRMREAENVLSVGQKMHTEFWWKRLGVDRNHTRNRSQNSRRMQNGLIWLRMRKSVQLL